MAKSRPYDLVVFGATGFTGRLTAEYLAGNAPETLKWAVAGRSHQKLEELRADLARINSACADIGVIQANSGDQRSLREMTAQTRAVVTTVGPYVEYGEGLVQACVEAGTHYADLTGEPEFVDRCILGYDDAARANKVKIVNCCGFDSIPHDLGVLFTVEELLKGATKAQRAAANVEIEGFVLAGGSFSGGTWHSAVKSFSRVGQLRAQRRKLKMKLRESRDPARKIHSPRGRIHYRPELGRWACPFPTIDPEVVRRSAHLIPGYGQDFEYAHYVQVKRLPKLIGGIAGLAGIFTLAQIPPTRQYLLSIKNPGKGPTEEQRAKGWFAVTMVGLAVLDGEHSRSARVEITGGDPGYGETAKMLAESGMCLAKDGAKTPHNYGVITPAAAMGKALLKRLQKAGIGFEVVQSGRA